MIISKNGRTGKQVVLLPEFCEMTGLTDENRANFNLMKDMASVLHKDAAKRKQEVELLLQEMRGFPKVKKI